ncbi:MAG TPA: tRNA (adenosine(37)-N6)-threonylcarbamoyltransferase complex dimerization subunit type 1 TsaB [Silvibacterium sp.]|nr:tRNA (adenosine(37)-N6)-threonylcarbamoyltransferase complex dimerization subunit type 1 TsaB [Silvibacterium sp.]
MLLGIDTCGGAGSIVLARQSGSDIEPIAEAELAGKTYSGLLIPKISELLDAQQAVPKNLNAIVVTHGPGSFTGIRVGLSAAKGLAVALNIPLLAVSRLAVLASKAATNAAALDAGRGEFYFRIHSDEALLTPEDIRARLDITLAVCEENASQIFPNSILVPPPRAWDALLYALARLAAEDFDDVDAVDGNYVRRSDAELFAQQAAKR